MKFLDNSESHVVQKTGRITSDVKRVKGGISKSSGKKYDEFATFWFLPDNRAQAIAISVDMRFFDEVESVIAGLEYCTRVIVCGEEDSHGRFRANEVRRTED